MRLTRVEITGFRGALPPLPMELNEKSFFIYDENGRGKSTIADALEQELLAMELAGRLSNPGFIHKLCSLIDKDQHP